MSSKISFDLFLRYALKRDAHLLKLQRATHNILLDVCLHRIHARLLMCVLAIFATVCGLLVPVFQRSFVNELASAHEPWALVWMLGVVLAGVGQQFLNASFKTIGNTEGLYLQKALSLALYEKTMHLTADSRSKHTVGETVNFYAQDVPIVGTFVEDFFPSALIAGLSLTCAPIVISVLLDISIAGVLMVTSLSVAVSIWFGSRQARFFILNKLNAQARMGIVNEWLQNIRIIRILGWTERFEQKIFAARQEETRNRLAMVSNGSSMNSIAQVTPFLINVAGVYALVQQKGVQATPGDVFAVLWVFGVFFMRPLRVFPFLIAYWFDAKTSASRLEKYFALPQEKESLDSPQNSCESVSIIVKDLAVRLGEKTLLRGISLNIPAASFVVIVGEVGCGKSVLLQALMHLFPTSHASYELGDVAVDSMSLATLRAHFGYVSQEGFVMSASLRDNVTLSYDSQQDLDPQILSFLEAARFHPVGEHMPSGLHTEIGERGVNLSGGQRQRVNLARCGYFERPILLLDDCLSAVDIATEKALVDQLFLGLWKNKTRVLVTHRLSVLPHADIVILMENGEIVETGRFDELKSSSLRMKRYLAAHGNQSQPAASKGAL